jgi:1,2-diacylglycerol 3-beta-galactosyltransferase
MKASDFIISKAGGLIVSESLACGLPLLLSEALPGQEAGNARYVVDNQVGAWAPGAGEVLAIVHSWLKDGGALLDQLKANAATLGRPRAAFDIAETLWQMV